MTVVIDSKTPIGQFISERNRDSQFHFLNSCFVVSQNFGGLEINHEFICNLNSYATKFLSPQPGRYRRHYNVTVGDHNPSDWCLVYEEMEQFVNTLHLNWAKWNPVQAAAYALWGVNHVHPFCEGNGRTARALCYYVLCQKVGTWLPGENTIVEQIRTMHRAEHCQILQRMHNARRRPTMETDLAEMTELLSRLLTVQIAPHIPSN